MKAVLLIDIFDHPPTFQALEKSLNDKGIQVYPTTWDGLLDDIYFRRITEPFLLYWSAEMEIAEPKEILNFIYENKFAMMVFNHFPIAVDPTKVFYESYRFYALPGNHNFHIEPHTQTGRVTFKKPEVDPPRILIHTTGHRLDYLKLTINSLLYSLLDESVPLTILLNCAPKEAVDFVKGIPYSNKEILVNHENPGYAGINLMLQYHGKPDRFIAMEDDFILPQTTRNYFPNWPYLFTQRLNQVDLVGWMCETSNRPLAHCWPIPQTPLQHGWYHGSPEITYPIMGQCFATTWKHYLRCNEDETFISRDENLVRNARRYTAPFIKPYHVGWNQIMDGYERLPASGKKKYVLESLSSGAYKEIDIRDIRS